MQEFKMDSEEVTLVFDDDEQTDFTEMFAQIDATHAHILKGDGTFVAAKRRMFEEAESKAAAEDAAKAAEADAETDETDAE